MKIESTRALTQSGARPCTRALITEMNTIQAAPATSIVAAERDHGMQEASDRRHHSKNRDAACDDRILRPPCPRRLYRQRAKDRACAETAQENAVSGRTVADALAMDGIKASRALAKMS